MTKPNHRQRSAHLFICFLAATALLSLACSGDDDDDNNNAANNEANNETNNGGANISVGGAVQGETTWRGTVTLTGNTQLRGGTLTIEPGTTIIMCQDCTLDLGWNSSAATVLANGTADKPITIRGVVPGTPSWSRLIIGRNITSNSALRHVIVDGAGLGAEASVEVNAAVGLEAVTIKNGGAAGIKLANARAGGTVKVEQVPGHGAIISDDAALAALPDFTFGALGKNSIAITDTSWEERGSGEMQLKDHGVPYYIAGKVTQRSGNKLVVEAGVGFLMAADSQLELGWNSSATSAKFNGTAEEPITFVGEVAEAGSWDGVILGRNMDSTTALSHVKISHAGSAMRGALRVDAPVLLEDIEIVQSEGFGLDIGSGGLKAGSARVSVRGGTGYAMRAHGTRLLDVPVGGSFEGNAQNVVLVDDGCNNTQSGTLPAPGIAYLFGCAYQLRTDARWTIPAGVTLRFNADRSFEAGWNSSDSTLKIEGTAAAPVVFEGAEAGAMYWRGLIIGRNVTSDSYLRNIVVRGGVGATPSGQARGAAVRLDKLIEVKGAAVGPTSGNGISIERNLVPAGGEATIQAMIDENSFEQVAGQPVCAVNFTAGPYRCE